MRDEEIDRYTDKHRQAYTWIDRHDRQLDRQPESFAFLQIRIVLNAPSDLVIGILALTYNSLEDVSAKINEICYQKIETYLLQSSY
jgi:hypothetical protein